jgi:ABC-type dipeptide/oligopeptide/nickel transport system ATPase component
MADRVAVMYYGKIVETAPADEVFTHPKDAYTQALLASVPSLLKGILPGR